MLPLVGSPLPHLVQYCWPPQPSQLQFSVLDKGIPFQNTSLANTAIWQAWKHWSNALPDCTLLATDASKDACKTSAAALDVKSGYYIAGLVPQINSVFSAEAWAIYIALTTLSHNHPEVYILSDSLSVLSALRNWSFRSPALILLLIKAIHDLEYFWS